MQNKRLKCQDCCTNFVFTIKQQENYAEKGWQEPIRCPLCRARKKEIWMIGEKYRSIIKNKFGGSSTMKGEEEI